MRIMALDIGEKNIGIAISDKLNILAIPYSIERNDDNFGSKISEIIKEKDINKIIVGIPYNLKGKLGHQAKKTIDFIEELKAKTDIEIHFIDERFSTQISRKNLMFKKKETKISLDKYAAAVILENYLNLSKKTNDENEVSAK